MMGHQRRRLIRPRRWPAIAALAAGLSAVAWVRASLPPTAPAAPTGRRETPAAAIGERPKPDARSLSIGLMALATFGKTVDEGRGLRSLAATAGFLRDWQWNEGRGCPPSHRHYGGTGRWPESAPDLIHTAMLLQAMRATGVAANDPYIRRASLFVARCQLIGEPRAPADGDRADLGGFSTGPIVDAAGTPAKARLGRPTGASTCLGLTGLLAAGIAPDDRRIRAALGWLEGHYSLDAHPGMTRAREGLYGYYYEFARAMTALGCDRIRDPRGVVHDWRAELGLKLAEQQNPDGSWTNPDESREPAECSPSTITSLALLTLRQLQP